MIFPPEARPELYAKLVPSGQEIKCKVVELAKDNMILQSDHALPLRGKITFKRNNESEDIDFHKVEEAQVDDCYYSEVKINADDLFGLKVHFLARQSVEDLTHWLMDAGENKSETPRPLSALATIENLSEPAPPQGPIAAFIGSILHFFYQHWYVAILLFAVLSIFPAMQIKKLAFDPSLDRLLVQDGKEMLQYKESIQTFGPDRVAILYFEDPAIFTPEKLTTLRKLAWELQKYPKAQKVQSLFTTSFIHSMDDTVYTEPAFQELEEININETLNALERDPLLRGRLFNRKQNSMVIILPILPEYNKLAVIAEDLDRYLAPLKPHFKKAFVTGEPKVELFGAHEMKDSQRIYIPLIGLILLMSFYFFIKSLSAFFVTCVVTFFSIFWSFGIMSFFHIPVQMMVSLIPSIVLMLSATEIIHIFSSYHYALHEGHSQKDSLKFIGQDIGKALFLTFSTTALGFLSIRFSDILILQEFAIVSSMALFIAFMVTLIYFPLHIRLFQRHHTSEDHDSGNYKSNPIFEITKNYFTKFYFHTFLSKKALWIIGVLAIINALLGLRLYVDNDAYAMLAESTQVKKDISYFKEHIGGTKNIHIVIESLDSSFSDPKQLDLLWQLGHEIEKVSGVVHIESFAEMMALLNREMISGKEEDFKVPTSKNLIAQYMLTLSRDDLDPLISTDKKKVNLKIAHDISSSRETALLVKKLEEILKEHISKDKNSFYLTSRNILNLHAAHTIVKGQVNSLITMAIIIVVMLSLFFKSIKIGLISLIPNLFPIFGLFGIMAIFGIPLNIGTSIVAAITIGIAADDTIHLFSRYLIDESKGHNPIESATMTIEEEVIPIITTSLSLAFSYMSFGLSSFIPLVEFGALSAYVLVLAVISDLYIGPAILSFFITREKNLKKFEIPLLINAPDLHDSLVFHNFNNQEIYSTIKEGKLLTLNTGKHNLDKYVDEEGTFFVLLKGESDSFSAGSAINQKSVELKKPSILLKITKSQLTHLSPRIFSKFCNNLNC